MTNRHPTIGGKTPRTQHAPKADTANLLITCDGCEAQYLTPVHVGKIDLYKPCDCGALIHVTGYYDGYAVEIYGGTVEEVEK